MEITVRILYSAGCAHTPGTIDLVEDVIAGTGSVKLELVEVIDFEQARELNFLGSPTVQVNGVDIDPQVRGTVSSGFT